MLSSRAACAAVVGLLVVPMVSAGNARADSYLMGVGQWTCTRMIDTFTDGAPVEKGQAAGWILGFWSAATSYEGDAFTARVQKVGGEQVMQATIRECSNNPEALVGVVSSALLVKSRS
jgi:hypothetical protein